MQETIKGRSEDELVLISGEMIGAGPSGRALQAQAELTNRLIKTLRSLERTSTRQANYMSSLTYMLFVLAFLQSFFAIWTLPYSISIRSIVFAAFVMFMTIVFKMVDREFFSQKEKNKDSHD